VDSFEEQDTPKAALDSDSTENNPVDGSGKILLFLCYTALKGVKHASPVTEMCFIRSKIRMKQLSRASNLLRHIPVLLLSAPSLSISRRLLIVAVSYGLGLIGLWLFIPILHNAVSLVLPIMVACWLFRYRGLLLCIPLILGAMGLIYLFLLPDALVTNQSFSGRLVLGLGIALLLGLVICWLRAAFDLVSKERLHAFTAEQERIQAIISYDYQCKLNELKDQFLMNVSHELRTPLTVMGGYLDLLKELNEALDSKGRVQMLDEALKTMEELSGLVSRVLDATKVASEIPLVKSEAVNVHQLLQELLRNLAPLHAQSYTIHLNTPEQIMVWADPQFLRQILNNLLSNIFKYVPTQTEIRIEVAQATPASPVYLSVQDAGPGIPAEEIPLLFEKFVRLKRDQVGSKQGTGLGLYICEQLVQAMGGRIWVESPSSEGIGSRFCITLPPFSPSLPRRKDDQLSLSSPSTSHD
jgi:signal transduction histidine kinase